MFLQCTVALLSLLREPGNPRGAVWKKTGFYSHSTIQALWHCKWLKACVQLCAVLKIFPEVMIVQKVALSVPFSENYGIIKKLKFFSEDVTLVRLFNGLIIGLMLGYLVWLQLCQRLRVNRNFKSV